MRVYTQLFVYYLTCVCVCYIHIRILYITNKIRLHHKQSYLCSIRCLMSRTSQTRVPGPMGAFSMEQARSFWHVLALPTAWCMNVFPAATLALGLSTHTSGAAATLRIDNRDHVSSSMVAPGQTRLLHFCLLRYRLSRSLAGLPAALAHGFMFRQGWSSMWLTLIGFLQSYTYDMI